MAHPPSFRPAGPAADVLPRSWPGLTEVEATEALARLGPNSLPPPQTTSLAHRILHSLRDPLVLVLIAAAALTLATRDLADTLVIGLVIIVNTALAVRQEVTADRAVRALSDLLSPRARVVRDGHQRSVRVADIVVGDVIVLGEGDLVPADCLLLEAVAVRVDESSLTGESVPVEKDSGALGNDGRVLWSGTTVVHGRARAGVTATGPDSALGRIATMLDTGRVDTPFQRRMSQLSGLLAVSAIALCALVMVIGLLRGQPLELMVLTAISLAVAAVPESLPVVVTISLALAARRMAQRRAVVRNLAAVETLGSVTLLATDKTGTLTQARMVLDEWWCPDGADASQLWRNLVLCNDASSGACLTGGAGGGVSLGDPMEVALLRAAVAAGEDAVAVRLAWPRVAELPFDSTRKRMTTVHRDPAAGFLVVCKGAPESVLADAVVDAPESIRAEAWQRSREMAERGGRVLALAAGWRADPSTGLESGLALLGLVSLKDPPRAAAAETVAACRAAGVDVALVTGDHPATAAAIAKAVRLSGAGSPPDALGGSGPDAIEALSRSRVIARATPADKLGLVSKWQQDGHVVAMTGDGVNDAPALRRADIGIAMGQRGTEVARQAADLLLTDDDLATVVAAVEEGRRVYANIRRFLVYGLTGGSAEILVMLGGWLVGLPLPLLPAQILWVNLLTHSFAGAALGSEPVEVGTMAQPPRDPRQGVLGGGLGWRILALGLALAAASLACGRLAGGGSAQSSVLLVLGAGQLGVAWGVRARTAGSGRGVRDRLTLPTSLALAALLLVAAVTVAPLRALLSTTPVTGLNWLAAALAAALAYLLSRVLRPRAF